LNIAVILFEIHIIECVLCFTDSQNIIYMWFQSICNSMHF